MHAQDVQPANKSDGWNTEPFTLVHDKKTDRLYGRGSTDDKGPVLGWLNVRSCDPPLVEERGSTDAQVIEAHRATKTELPVNLKMCFEGVSRALG